MNRIAMIGLIACSLIGLGCASDIKGEAGAAGKDATSNAVIPLNKPGFHSIGTNNKAVVVAGSTSVPSKVLIADTVYTNTTEVTCDLTATGRNGLDVGSLAAHTVYYLYAIPPATGSTFDSVASINPPTNGPVGFTDWSYLGAFATPYDVTTLDGFRSDKGRLMANYILNTAEHTADTAVTQLPIVAPITASTIMGELGINGSGSGYGAIMGWNSTSNPYYADYVQLDSTDTKNTMYVEIALEEPAHLYLKVSDATFRVSFNMLGWQENPSDWK